MAFPDFFAAAPRIRVRDPLAALLGASDDGSIEYGYADAVRVAGHSCPTVAGAWLMARAALRALYPDGPAERGGIRVTMQAAETEGTTGVVAQIFTLLTGAAAGNGFHGIGGRFVRADLLRYGDGDNRALARFRRRDSGLEVGVRMDLSSVPAAPELPALMPRALAPDASADEQQRFGHAWQDRVRRLLLDHADDANVIMVEHYA
ncbi:MAG TPA: FmdE family protein [Rhodanobacteraceae bacterium]|nr:FmdE family protein [Rhodanobacteraceae bacterium]